MVSGRHLASYVLASMLLLVIVWPGSAVVYTSRADVPKLETGDFWAYRTVDHVWNRTMREFRIVEGQQRYDGLNAIVVDSFIFIESGRMMGSMRVKQWITQDWRLLHEELIWYDGSGEVRTYSPPLQLYSFPLKEGKVWRTPMNMSGEIVNGASTVEIFSRGAFTLKVVGLDVVVVPAGVYPTYSVSHGSGSGQQRMVYYFNSEVKNTVKEEHQMRIGGGWEPLATTELTSFSVTVEPEPSLTVPLPPTVLAVLAICPLAIVFRRTKAE